MDPDDIYMENEEYFGPIDQHEPYETYDILSESLSSSQRHRKEAASFMMLESPQQALNFVTGQKLLLDLFKNKQERKPPKKEYIRCKLIRGHKRANRQVSQKVIPARTLNRFECTNQDSINMWKKMIEVYELNKVEINQVSPTEAGPLTDGKKKRIDSDAQKSFNDKFCRQYFSSPAIRESYFYYIELLYSDFNLDILCNKFEIFCCPKGQEHISECEERWRSMKSYMQFDIIISLDITPFSYPSLPISKSQERQDNHMEEDIISTRAIPEMDEIDSLLNI